jgi:phosphate transport system substrate-binding protein
VKRPLLPYPMALASWIALAGACQTPPAHDTASPRPVRIVITGASSMVPLSTEASNRYMKEHPGTIIEVSTSASQGGLADVLSGKASIGNSDVAAAPDQEAALDDTRVAVAGIAAVANAGPFNAAVASISRSQLREIFAGRIRNWKEVGGGNQAISVLHRGQDSGTRRVFSQLMMDGLEFTEGQEVRSSGAMQTALLQTRGAISYLVLSHVVPGLKALALNGVAPTSENIIAGTYPLWAYEHMYVKRPRGEAVVPFLDFVLSPTIQDELPRLGFVPIGRMKATRGPSPSPHGGR